MSYYPRGRHYQSGDEVDDVDGYDVHPYKGGYDIYLTYGRPLPPSKETCYSTSPCSFYSFCAKPCAYLKEALDNEYKNYVRRKPRPGHPPEKPSSEKIQAPPSPPPQAL